MYEELQNWDFGEISDEEILSNRSNSGDNQYARARLLRPEQTIYVWILTNPNTSPEELRKTNDWVNFRQCPTYSGLKVGELPNYLKWGVPVRDFARVHGEAGKYRIDNNLDPLTAGTPGNQLFVSTATNTDPKTKLIRVSWKTVFNVIDAITQEPYLLIVSHSAAKQMKEYIQTIEEEVENFDIRNRPVAIKYYKKGTAIGDWKVSMRRLKIGSTVAIGEDRQTIYGLDAFPDTIDCNEYLKDERKKFDRYINSLPTQSGDPFDSSSEDPNKTWSWDEGEAPDWAKEDRDTEDATDESEEIEDELTGLSPVQLRNQLKKIGIEPERGASRDTLLAMLRSQK